MNQRGEILMSVLVSGVILTVVMVIFLSSIGQMNGLEEHQNHKVKALEVSQSFLEELNLSLSSDARMQPGAHTFMDGDYTLNWNVLDDNPVPGIKKVDLDVEWVENTFNKKIQLTTYHK